MWLYVREAQVNALIAVSLAFRRRSVNEGTMCEFEEPLTPSVSVTSVTA